MNEKDCVHKFEKVGLNYFSWAIILLIDILIFAIIFMSIWFFQFWWVSVLLIFMAFPANPKTFLCRKCGKTINLQGAKQ